MKRKVVPKSLFCISTLLALYVTPVSAAGLEIQKNDVITVLKNCVPYLAVFIVILIVAIIFGIACRRYDARKRIMLRGQAAIVTLLTFVVVVNQLCLGPVSTLLDVVVQEKGEVTEETEVDMSTPKTTVGILYSAKMKKSLENDILSSALTHILDMTYVKSIREEEGGTYGVSAMTGVSEATKQVSTVIVFDTDPAKADELIALAKQEYEAIAENGTEEEYIEKARTALVKAFPEAQISNSYWQGVINDYVFYGYDSHSNYIETVEKCVNNENIAEFVKKTLKGGNMRELVMNPAK